jgi:hypothetical protein
MDGVTMTDTLPYLLVILLASTAGSDAGVTVSNSLAVTRSPQQRNDVRVYWQGKRVPKAALLLEGLHVTFENEKLTIYPDYARVDYDPETDTIL